MKSILSLMVFCFGSYMACGQQTVNFNNRVPLAGIDAPVSYAPGTLFGGQNGLRIDGAAHTTAQAALYAGPDGSSLDQLVLIGPAIGFLGGASAGYFNVGSSSARAIPGLGAGDFAIVQVRAWDAANGTTAASYEAAQALPGALFGTSTALRIQMGSLGQSVDLIGLQPFSIGAAPEPGTLALIGVGVLLAGWIRLRAKLS